MVIEIKGSVNLTVTQEELLLPLNEMNYNLWLMEIVANGRLNKRLIHASVRYENFLHRRGIVDAK